MSARILVVDDSASMRQMVSFALTSAGFAVEEAEDGAVALGRAKGQRFNAVVTDVNMPNMDGISLIRELRQLAEYKFTPMLMLTTESAADKKSEGKAAGATGCRIASRSSCSSVCCLKWPAVGTAMPAICNC